MQGNYVIVPATPGFELWQCSVEAFDACHELENFEEAFAVYAIVAWKIEPLTRAVEPLALYDRGADFEISAVKQPDGSFVRIGWYPDLDGWIAALVEERFRDES